MDKPQSLAGSTRWFPFLNGAGQQIPSYACLSISNADVKGQLTAIQPTTNGQDVFINSPTPVPTGAYGVCSQDWPVVAAYNAGDGVPAPGDTWGAGAASWTLRKGNAGFTVLGGVSPGPPNSSVLVNKVSGAGAQLNFAKIVGVSATAANLYDATLQNYASGSIVGVAGASVWCFYPLGLTLTNNDIYPCFPNGSFTAQPAAGGANVSRPLYLVVAGGWVSQVACVGGIVTGQTY